MRARRGLIPTSFLVLLLPLILVSCSGGGNEAPQSLTAPPPDTTPQPPAPAGLIWSTSTGIFRSQTDGSDRLTLAEAPHLRNIRPHLEESVILYEDGDPDTGITLRRANVNGSGTQALVVLDERGQSITQFLLDAIGPWVIYGNNGLAASRLHSVTLDGVLSQGAFHECFIKPASVAASFWTNSISPCRSICSVSSQTLPTYAN